LVVQADAGQPDGDLLVRIYVPPEHLAHLASAAAGLRQGVVALDHVAQVVTALLAVQRSADREPARRRPDADLQAVSLAVGDLARHAGTVVAQRGLDRALREKGGLLLGHQAIGFHASTDRQQPPSAVFQ
jgi:hypothetical protein